MSGTYHETIKPQNSGEKGKTITYASYLNDEVIISDITIGVDLRNKHYIVIDSLTIRNNIMINNGSFCLESKEDQSSLACHNRIYHNTFYKNYMALFYNCKGTVNDNILKNNIFYKNRDYEIHKVVTGTPRKDYYLNNNIMGNPIYYYPDGKVSVSYLQSEYPNLWKYNVSLNPMFKDEEERDLRLQPSSPLIDGGVFLTQTRTQGSGKKISVEDAGYFMDGWGIINGDTIQLEGKEQTATITHVDYKNNVITVDKPLVWNLGQKISLVYQGYAPDIGAYEYGENRLTNGVNIFIKPDRDSFNEKEEK